MNDITVDATDQYMSIDNREFTRYTYWGSSSFMR